MKSYLLNITKALILISVGVLLHYSLTDYTWSEGLPKPELPQSYQKYEIHYLATEWKYRNCHIQKFYEAWEKKDSYAICDEGMGIDSPMSVIWITDKGKLTRMLVDYTGFNRFSKINYTVDEVKAISLCTFEYDDENGNEKYQELIQADPNIYSYDLIIRPRNENEMR